MHRRHDWIILALLIIVAILAFLLYRRDKTHTLSFDNTGAVVTAKQGDVLEWRPAYSKSDFDVAFWASTPCVDDNNNPEPDVTSKNGVASCKVGNVPNGKVYGFNFQAAPTIPRPQYPCKGCLYESPVDHPFVPLFVVPGTPEAAHAHADATTVNFTCSNGSFRVAGPDGNPKVISWLPDAAGTTNWHVTFPSDAHAPQLCNEGTDFADGHATCTLAAPLSGQNHFKITSTECQNDQTPFPAPSQ